MAKRAEGLMTHPAAQATIMPFFRTPAQLIKYVSDGTPIGAVINKRIRDDIMGANGDIAQAKTLGHMATVSSAMVAAWHFVETGRATGSFMGQEYDTAAAAGVIPNAVNMSSDPDSPHWVEFNRFDPFGSILFAVADVKNRWDDLHDADGNPLVPPDELGAALMFAALQNMSSKTWAKGVGDTIMALQDFENAGSRMENMGINMLAKYAPLGGLFASMTAPHRNNKEFETESLVEKVLKTYGITSELREKLDIFGKPIPREVLHDALPLKTATQRMESPARQFMYRFGPDTRVIKDMVKGVQLSREHHWELQRIVDEEFGLEAICDEIVLGGGPELGIVQELQETIQSIRQDATDIFLERHPEIADKIISLEILNEEIAAQERPQKTEYWNMRTKATDKASLKARKLKHEQNFIN
jgi:hypothetical protein